MSKKKYNPLKARPNPEIEQILFLVKKNCDELLNEKDFTRRKGKAFILMAHLKQLTEETEFLVDVEKRLIHDSRYWMKVENFVDDYPDFLEIKPFDLCEKDEEKFFFYSNNKLSFLYSKPPLDPYYYRSSDYSFVVYTLEKIYATFNKTSVHINDYQVVERCLKEIKSQINQTFIDEKNKYFVLADPQGVSYGLPLTMTITNNQKEAILIADFLTQYLAIRFLVAKQIYVFDSH